MNKTILLGAAGLASVTAFAQIDVADYLAIGGFIDMSYSSASTEGDRISDDSDTSFAVDQVEINFFVNYENVSGQIDIDTSGGLGSLRIEQAFATYSITDMLSITAGRYDSSIGFDAFEPTGLYQFSLAYDLHDATGLAPSFAVSPGQLTGINVDLTADAFSVGGSIVDGIYGQDGRLGGESEDDDDAPNNSTVGVEVYGAFTGVEGLLIYTGFAYDWVEATNGSNYIDWTYNLYGLFETGPVTVGAEIIYGEYETLNASGLVGTLGDDAMEFLTQVMVNFAITDQAAVTGRISRIYGENDDTNMELEAYKLTVSPSFVFTDNLSGLVELSYVTGETEMAGAPDTEFESWLLAAELIFAF